MCLLNIKWIIMDCIEKCLAHLLLIFFFFIFKLYDQVVLEGQWQEGYMAMAAIGATNIGSIEVGLQNFPFQIISIICVEIQLVRGTSLFGRCPSCILLF